MFGNKETKSKILALGIVAMFMMTGVFCFGSDADSNKTYTVNLFTGSHYEYTPSVNIATGTTEFTATGLSSGMTFTNNTLAFNAPSTPNQNYGAVTITATWTSAESSSVTQTASQIINFKVWQAPAITAPSENINTYSTVAAGTTIATPTITGQGATITSVEIRNSQTNQTSSDFTYSTASDGKSCIVSTAKTNMTPGTYVVKVNGRGEVNANGDSHANTITSNVSAQFNVVVLAGASDAVLEPTTYVTYYGQNEGPSGATTTYIEEGVTLTPGTIADAVISVKDSANTNIVANGPLQNKTLRINTNAVQVTGANAQIVNFKLNLHSDAQNLDKDFNCTVKIYPTLEFTEAPTIATFNAVAGGNEGLTVRTNIEFAGAKTITYNWGDNSAPQTITLNGQTSYEITHDYTKSGLYTITATVMNDYGTVQSTRSYNADTGESTETVSAHIKATTTTENGKKMLVLSVADDSILPADPHYKWYKGTVNESNKIGTASTCSVEISTIEKGDVFTLTVANAAENPTATSTTTYTYEGESSDIMSQITDFIDRLMNGDHQAMFMVAIAVGIIFAIIGFAAGSGIVGIIGGLIALVALGLMFLGY